MSYLRWQRRPQLRRPVLISAFAGWVDAGESATTATKFLTETLGAEPFCTIDPEDFYDFTVARPRVRLDEQLDRHIEFPTPTFSTARLPGAERDIVFLHAVEPALKWRTYCQEAVTVCQEIGVEMALTLGALLADVPHTRPVRVNGTSTDPGLLRTYNLQRSRYQGPTGISSVLHDAFGRVGIPAASLYAATPAYLSQTPSPKAARALVSRVLEMLAGRVDLTTLDVATSAYERQVDEMLSVEDDVVDYVRRLEQQDDSAEKPLEIPPADHLAAEVERFLREQPPS